MSTFTRPSPTGRFPSQADMAAELRTRVRLPAGKPTDPALREFHREVGARIRLAREAKGWRREDLALALGKGFKSVQNYESVRVPLELITELAEALDVEVRWLLHGEETEMLRLLQSTAEQVETIVRSQTVVHERLEGIEARLQRPANERTGQA